jgi:hypothetical protein
MDEVAPLAKNLKATISITESAIGSEALQPVILADKASGRRGTATRRGLGLIVI